MFWCSVFNIESVPNNSQLEFVTVLSILDICSCSYFCPNTRMNIWSLRFRSDSEAIFQFRKLSRNLTRILESITLAPKRPILVSAGFLPPDHSFGIGCRIVSGGQKPLMPSSAFWRHGFSRLLWGGHALEPDGCPNAGLRQTGKTPVWPVYLGPFYVPIYLSPFMHPFYSITTTIKLGHHHCD
jgi:hypothetical protein